MKYCIRFLVPALCALSSFALCQDQSLDIRLDREFHDVRPQAVGVRLFGKEPSPFRFVWTPKLTIADHVVGASPGAFQFTNDLWTIAARYTSLQNSSNDTHKDKIQFSIDRAWTHDKRADGTPLPDNEVFVLDPGLSFDQTRNGATNYRASASIKRKAELFPGINLKVNPGILWRTSSSGQSTVPTLDITASHVEFKNSATGRSLAILANYAFPNRLEKFSYFVGAQYALNNDVTVNFALAKDSVMSFGASLPLSIK